MGCPPFEPIREVRFGVVLYGGVSLAIYMSGVAQELLNMVRATAPDGTGTSCRVADEDLRGTEAVYRRVAQWTAPGAIGAASPISTRFVVDIISGSSAGGLNGVFLAKAMAAGKSLDSLKQLWLREGDLDRLINDKGSLAGYEGLGSVNRPESLLNGDRMYALLLRALDHIDAEPAREAEGMSYADDVDLWVTTTDLGGIDLPLAMGPGPTGQDPLTERRHRCVFHFALGEVQDDDGARNDFGPIDNPFLAFAGRATSSFPFAFRPMKLRDIDPLVLATSHRHDEPNVARPSDSTRWRPFFADHLRADPPVDYREQNFSDGGDIDNMPFGYVIDTLAKRRSTVPVDRKVLFVDPIPSRPTAPADTKRPDVVASVFSAVSLGREETIRDDLVRLEQRNQMIDQLARATTVMTEAVGQAAGFPEPVPKQAWLAETPAEMWAQGPGYIAYLRLRFELLVDDFADSLSGVTQLDEPTARTRAMRGLVAAWALQRYGYPDTAPNPVSGKQFLSDFDIAYRLRRLMFVAQRANARFADYPADRSEVRDIKNSLNDAVKELAKYVPALRTRFAPGKLTESLAALGLRPAVLDEIAGAPDPDAAANDVLVPGVRALFDQFADGVAFALAVVFASSTAQVQAVLGPQAAQAAAPGCPSAKAELRWYYDHFATYDEALLPALATAGEVGEMRRVEVSRVSPDDAVRILGVDPPRKLAGEAMAHFGGFLDASWRRNDIMWGRLDAAECLIKAVLPDDSAHRAWLIDEALTRILEEEQVTGATTPSAEPRHGGLAGAPGDMRAQECVSEITKFATGFEVPTKVDGADALHLVGRSAGVIGKMLKTLEGKAASVPAVVLLWFGRIAWGVAELAVPGSIGQIVLRHGANLVALMSVLLVLLGGVARNPTLVATGWLVLGGILVARALLGVAVALVRRQWSVLFWLGAAAMVVVAVFLAGVGIHSVADWIGHRACDWPDWVRRVTPHPDCPA